ncbi:MAG: PLP-dependent aminotransferase family protein [Burkholderiales bacterium]
MGGEAPLQRGASHGLSAQLAARYAERIGQGLLPVGARLPSVRACSMHHGVSPSTVVSAYDQLQAQGLVEARRQRGFFVRERPSGAARENTTPALALSPPVDANALIRGMFTQSGGASGPGSGTLPAEWLDAALLQRALRHACNDAAGLLRYGNPAGDSGLRAGLARRLADQGIACAAGQLITTTGATQALDLVARTLLVPGDAVLVDEPGWTVEYARLSRLGIHLLPVPRTPLGPDLGVLEHLARTHRPKLYVTVSVLHNPTGCNLPLAAAHQVLRLAETHDFTIVEDDTYAWFAPVHVPRLAALDGLRRSVYLSGFSKILAPSWRVGFMAAPPALVQRLIDTKMIASLTTPSVTEQAIAWCLDKGLLRRHAERVLDLLDAARNRTRRLAEDAGCRFVTPPQGLFGWIETGVDTDALAQALLHQGWLLAPGSLFHAVRRPSTLMRINFATAQDARFWQAFKRWRERAVKAR